MTRVGEWFLDTQRKLSRWQAIIILGMPVSVVKFGFGAIQMVVGMGQLLAGVTVGPFNKNIADWVTEGIVVAGAGGFGMGYALGNFCTFGILGTLIEGIVEDRTR